MAFAVNDTWDESYGLNGGGDDIPLTIAGPATLRFLFDDTAKRVGVCPPNTETAEKTS